MATIKIKLDNRDNVSQEPVTSFISDLVSLGYISTPNGIDYVTYDHFDESLGDRAGETFKPDDTESALKTIKENGIEFLGVGIKYINHYGFNEGLESNNIFGETINELNRVSAHVADELGHDSMIDIDGTLSIVNGTFTTEFGEISETSIKISGDGTPPDEDFTKYTTRFDEVATDNIPSYKQLKQLMSKHFNSDVVIDLEYDYF